VDKHLTIALIAVALVVSIPLVYGIVEPSMILNMDFGQTTKPLQIKDSFGTEVFSVDTSGTIFPVQGGEVFTWTADHDASGNNLLNVGEIQINNPANTFQYIITPNAITADRILNLPLISDDDTLVSLGLPQTFSTTKTFQGGIRLIDNSQVLLGTGLDARINYNAGQFTITPDAVGTSVFRINQDSFNLDVPTLTSNTEFVTLANVQTLNFKTLTNAIIDCSLNTCTNFPSSPSSYTVFGSRFANLNPTNNFFNFPSGQSDAIGNETEMVMTMTTSGTIDRLFFKYITNGLDIPTTVTVRKNFADTSLTLSNPASSNAVVSNVVNSFTFVSGDEISINFVIGAGTGIGTKPNWSFEITQ